MEDTHITFETAKLAKEKLFPQSRKAKGKFRDDGSIENLGIGGAMVDTCKEWYERPTQSLLAKWLREEYNIRVFPIQKIAGDFGFEIYIPNKDNPVGKPFERLAYFTLHFKTYEEAYEIGLQEALKLT